jgi:hypothetical protein
MEVTVGRLSDPPPPAVEIEHTKSTFRTRPYIPKIKRRGNHAW